MANITYVLADTAHPESGRVALTQLMHLSDRGHTVALFMFQKTPSPNQGLPFPVFEFGYDQQDKLVSMLAARKGLRVATNWMSAFLVARIDDGRNVFMVTDYESKIARNYPELRAAVRSYDLGLPMITTSSWAAAQLEQIYGVEVPFVPPIVDNRTWHPASVSKDPAMVVHLSTSGQPVQGEDVFAEAIIAAHELHPLHLVRFGSTFGNFGAVPSRFEKVTSEQERVALLSSAGCYVSSSFHEVAALDQLYAMACGCPVVATRADGNDFCVDGENSLVVEPGDADALGAAIARLLSDSDLQDRLIAGGLETARAYRPDVVLPRLEQLFREHLQSASTFASTATSLVHSIEGGVSIVIPTKNGGAGFRSLMERIRRAQATFDVEVIVVDSGSTDDTLDIAREFGAKVIQIAPEEFNHGATRNLGAASATKEYLLFLTQDIIPMGDDWLPRLASPLLHDPAVAASTAREVPRSDADLFACWGIWNHRTALGLLADKTVALEGEDDDLRSKAQLQTNCLLVRRATFDEMRFSEVGLGEDLDLGLRLLRAGHHLAFLNSVGIIHSHTREPAYVLRRHYADAKWVPRILNSHQDLSGITATRCLVAADDLYRRLRCALSATTSGESSGQLGAILELVRSGECTEDGPGDPSLDEVFASLPEVTPARDDLLLDSFTGLVGSLRNYVDQAGLSLDNSTPEISMTLFKVLAATVGGVLGARASTLSEPFSDPVFRAIDDSLARGV